MCDDTGNRLVSDVPDIRHCDNDTHCNDTRVEVAGLTPGFLNTFDGPSPEDNVTVDGPSPGKLVNVDGPSPEKMRRVEGTTSEELVPGDTVALADPRQGPTAPVVTQDRGRRTSDEGVATLLGDGVAGNGQSPAVAWHGTSGQPEECCSDGELGTSGGK